MQYVNDDMDELFRRAAEDYPLDTGSADWSKVLAALQGQDVSKPVTEKKRNRNGRFLWLLLLLPLGFVCNRFYTPGDAADHSASAVVAQKQNPSSEKKHINTTQPAGENNANVISNRSKPSRTAETILEKSVDQSFSQTNFRSQSLSRNKVFAKASNTYAFNQENGTLVPEGGLDVVNGTAWERTYIPEIFFERAVLKTPEVFVNKELSPQKNPLEENAKKSSPLGRRQKKFYVGLIGGIDATTVKFQKIENKGHDFGVLVGYSFNKKWSIETGSFIENKFYYSEGKYFNTAKIYMPPNTRIEDVSGDCKMIEIPLSVNYNFSSHRNSGWFATLGSSSYFMKQENYTYNYYYGSVGPVAHSKEYKNSSTNVFANLSLSGGYTHSLGRFADLRIEPYLKIPVAGMGIGKLPLLSTGLHVGLTRKF